MIVVADTAPLNYLVQLECVQFLPVLYGRVLIPHAVVAELSDPNAPPAVSAWIANLPSWVTRTSCFAHWIPGNEKRSCWPKRFRMESC